MKRMVAALSKLTGGQRKIVGAELAALDSRPALASLLDARTTPLTCCVHCAGTCVVKNGTARGLQRYLCRGCGKSFCALTGTPLVRLQQRGKWLGHAQALRDGLSLHKVAERLHIAVSTAHRWRHRFLALPKAVQAQALTGVAEADETYFRRSCKGQRQGLGRPARKRGSAAAKRGTSKEYAAVLIARDRSGATANFILEAMDKESVRAALAPILPIDTILCTDGGGALWAAAKAIGVEHHAVNLSAGLRVDGPWHVQNVNNYHSRLKGWMGRFRGVATKYLDSYLGWFRTLDRSPPGGPQPPRFLAMAIGG